MRLYSFVNYYLSPLQHGLQTAHCVGDMSVAYKHNTPQHEVYVDWVTNHKTIIICNGGNSLQLDELYCKLRAWGEKFGLPVVRFNEDEQSLNGALTSVAMVIPAQYYEVELKRVDPTAPAMYVNKHAVPEFVEGRDIGFDFVSLIKSYRLA